MKSNVKFIKKIRDFFAPSSLRMRLTVGVAAVSALGISGVAIWMSVRMQYILIATHKQTIQYIGERFPRDVEIYSDMVSLEVGMDKAIANLTNKNTWLWIERNHEEVIAESANIDERLFRLRNVPPMPMVYEVSNGYWLICANDLMVNGAKVGRVYIAQDITNDQIMFLSLIRSLSVASILAIGVMVVAIAFYVNQSLLPLKKISQVSEKVSVNDLGAAKINLKNAPKEVKDLAETFEEMLVRLGDAWEYQRQLTSNVSHELRTPLTIVSGYIQSVLRRGNNLTQPQREALEIASAEANRTISLLQDLLDLARADSGRMHFQMEEINVNELVTEVVGMGRQYSDRQIILELNEENIKLKVDANRLKQILLNLIDNGVKYSEKEITVKVEKMGELGIIKVSDRGYGIPLAQQTRIFERFYRMDEARSRITGGTGLGLSIVKTLVEGMGGHISVRSQLGEGSTFIVSFPLYK